jgi:hypothetical protein
VNITNNAKRGGHDEDKYDTFGVKNSFTIWLHILSYDDMGWIILYQPLPWLLGGLCRRFFNSVDGFAALRFTSTGALLAARRIRILPMNQHA